MSSLTGRLDVEHRVLILAARNKDAELTGKMLATSGIHYMICGGLSHLAAELHVGVGALLTAEEMLEKGANHLAQQYLNQQPTWSELTFPRFFVFQQTVFTQPFSPDFSRSSSVEYTE